MGNCPSRRCFAGCDKEDAIAAIVSMVTIIKEAVSKFRHSLFSFQKNKQSPDFPKPGLCHVLKILYL